MTKCSLRVFSRRLLVSAIAILLSAVSAAADTTPKQLYNKSITVTWGEAQVVKDVSSGKTYTPTIRIEVVLYISSAGRRFTRSRSISGRFDETNLTPPQESTAVMIFRGNSMTYYGKRGGIGRQYTFAFDPSFSSCTVSIVVGKSTSSPKFTGIDGVVYELLSASVAAAACSIKDGNAFTGG
jgi:hypothetical protein